MKDPLPLDRETEIKQILKGYLTLDLVCRYATREAFVPNRRGDDARKRLFADLLEQAGRELTGRLGRDLLPGEVVLTFESVKKLLALWGLY